MHYYFAANISDEDAARLGCEPGLHAVITPIQARRDAVRKSFSKDIGENFSIGEIESSSFIAGETDNLTDINMVFYALSELQIETAEEDFGDDEDGSFDDDDDDEGGAGIFSDDDDDGDSGEGADADEDEDESDEDEEEADDEDVDDEDEEELDIDEDGPKASLDPDDILNAPTRPRASIRVDGKDVSVKKYLAGVSAKTGPKRVRKKA